MSRIVAAIVQILLGDSSPLERSVDTIYDDGEVHSPAFAGFIPDESVSEADWMFYDPNIRQMLTKSNAI